jgi:hypothetical protein
MSRADGPEMELRCPDKTNAAEYVGTAMRSRLDELSILLKVAAGEESTKAERVAVDLAAAGEQDADDGWDVQQEAEDRIVETPLCIQTATIFEVVLGTGGPDDRLNVECIGGRALGCDAYEIRRILYRYTWSGSGVIELFGEDFDTAEAFARRVVAELAE